MTTERVGKVIDSLTIKEKDSQFREALRQTLDKIQRNEVLVEPDGEVLKSLFSHLFTEYGHLSEFSKIPECRESILERQLERLNTGRGRAIVTAIDGDDVFQQFRKIFVGSANDSERSSRLEKYILSTKIGVYRAWADQEAVFHRGLKKTDDYSSRRGLENVLADSVSLAWGTLSPTDYVTKLNQRRKIGSVAKPSEMVSIPKSSLLPTLSFIVELCATPPEQLETLKASYDLTDETVNMRVLMGLDAKKPVKKDKPASKKTPLLPS